jgi:hypothetical protein
LFALVVAGLVGGPASGSLAGGAPLVVVVGSEDDFPPTDPPVDVPVSELPDVTLPSDPAVVDDTAGDPLLEVPDLPAGDGVVTPTSRLTAVEDLPVLVGPTTVVDASPVAARRRGASQKAGLAGADAAADPVTWEVEVAASADGGIDTVPGALVLTLSTDELPVADEGALKGNALVEEGDEEGDASTRVVLDYSEFAGLWGGGWADRLTVSVLPDCFATTPDVEECRLPVAVTDQVNKVATDRLSWQMVTGSSTDDVVDEGPAAERTVPRLGKKLASLVDGGGGVSTFVVGAGAAGASGSWGATPTAASTQWQVGPGTGGFSYSYRFEAPAGPAGNAPAVSLGYSSASVDGMTASENSQGGVAGVGWNLQTAYVTRSYTSCSDDGQGWADWCWLTQGGDVMDDASIVLDGQASELVEIASDPGSFRLADDPGWKVTLRSNADADNGDNNNEYWRVETPDGTVYVFGWGRDGSTATNSVWTAPVFGNDDGEPCNRSWPLSCQRQRHHLPVRHRHQPLRHEGDALRH